jgi:starvation-inducible DNA-binding protein
MSQNQQLSAPNTIEDVPDALTLLLAEMVALYVKTRNFHWHVSRPRLRDYHLLLDDQTSQIFATTDVIAERVHELGRPTLKSSGQIAVRQLIGNNNAGIVSARDMLDELLRDNRALAQEMHAAHQLCDENGDIATASLLENWIDEADGRVWFLFEALEIG